MAVLSKPALAALSTFALMALVRRYGVAAVRAGNANGALVSISDTKGNTAQDKKAGINVHFLKKLLHLLRICIPSIFSPEAGVAVLIAALMVARSEEATS